MGFFNKLFNKKQGTTDANNRTQAQPTSMQNSDSLIEKLREQLQDSNLELRASAVVKLGQMGDLRSIPWLVDSIRDEYIQRNELADEYQAEVQQ